MTLPQGFDTPFEYFQYSLEFLNEYSWIYKEANTCYIKANVLENMSIDSRNFFLNISNDQLNEFPYVQQKEHHIPERYGEVKAFRQQLARLIPEEAFKEPAIQSEANFKTLPNLKRMNLKKQHEIHRLANVIHQQLGRSSEEKKFCVIDFGCGLGYLSEILYRLNEDIFILGLESDKQRVEAASQRLKSYLPQATNAIHYSQQFITEDSSKFISKSVEQLMQANYAPSSKLIHSSSAHLAIIGLHACADLSVTSMKLFLQMPRVRHLMIMPCCYHKMAMCDSKEVKFNNFPLSASLKKAMERHSKPLDFLNRPFLRLACQQTLKRWQKSTPEQHEAHGRDMFLRAVAEAIIHDTEIVIKRKNFKECNLEQMRDFDTFTSMYVLKSKVNEEILSWNDSHRKKFAEIMESHKQGEKMAEALTCLQTAMQKLCENLVLFDRLCYMQEAARDLNLSISVNYKKLMDEELSPRCYVLIAEKL